MGCLNSIRVLGLSAALAFAASPVIKVDFDMSGRNSSEVTEPNYVPWVVSGVSSKDTPGCNPRVMRALCATA